MRVVGFEAEERGAEPRQACKRCFRQSDVIHWHVILSSQVRTTRQVQYAVVLLFAVDISVIFSVRAGVTLCVASQPVLAKAKVPREALPSTPSLSAPLVPANQIDH